MKGELIVRTDDGEVLIDLELHSPHATVTQMGFLIAALAKRDCTDEEAAANKRSAEDGAVAK